MRVRQWFGLSQFHPNYGRMKREIKHGDTIKYVDRGLYGAKYEVKTGIVQMVADKWVFVVGDDAILWDNILEWEPT